MNRIAIFAHFDIKNVIDDYVLFYVKELEKVAQKVIFVSCCDLPQEELNKLSCIKIAKKHKEYDFGSYKRGFNYANEHNLLDGCNELIFCNDSCYGPFKPLDKIFDKMEDSTCDFWGMTKNKYGFRIKNGKARDVFVSHIQSYFLVLKPSVFNSDTFKDFIKSVEEQNDKNLIIEKYEIGLTKALENAGYKSDYVIKDFYKYNNPTVFRWRDLYVNSDFPFIKCSLLRLQNTLHTTIEDWQELFNKDEVKLIEQNLKYTSRYNTMRHFAPKILKKFVFDVMPNGMTKKAVIARLLLKTVGRFLMD